jgi:hypothetical protein
MGEQGGTENAGEPERQPTILEQAASIFDSISRARWWMSTDDVGSSILHLIYKQNSIIYN